MPLCALLSHCWCSLKNKKKMTRPLLFPQLRLVHECVRKVRQCLLRSFLFLSTRDTGAADVLADFQSLAGLSSNLCENLKSTHRGVGLATASQLYAAEIRKRKGNITFLLLQYRFARFLVLRFVTVYGYHFPYCPLSRCCNVHYRTHQRTARKARCLLLEHHTFALLALVPISIFFLSLCHS